jgi:hypothetical protein
MANFVDIDFAADEQTLLGLVTDRLTANGWTPEDADPEVVFAEALAAIAATLSDAIGQVPSAVFRKFGTDLLQVAYQPAAPATALVTITLNGPVEGTPFTLDAGTQFQLGDSFYFTLVDDLSIAVGDSSAVNVELRALVPGSDSNGLSGSAQSVNQIADIAAVTVVGTTGGGADAEDDTDYQNRIRDELTLLTPRPITESDYAILARNVPLVPVGRSTAIDGYNPADSTTNNERMVAVFVTAADGTALDAGDKAAILDYLQARRELNFVVTVNDPSYNAITVTYTVKLYPGFDESATLVAINSALDAFLSPLTWGTQGQTVADIGTLNLSDWSNETVVRWNKVVGVIESVSGVDYVTALDINGGGEHVDFTMTGAAPLPTNGGISSSVA